VSQTSSTEAAEQERPFDMLADALQAGDSGAWKQVVTRYTPRLIALARRRLDQRLRQKLSGEDVVQSVYRTFIRRHKEKPYKLESWESLWGLLVVMAVRKCSRAFEHYRTQGRDVRREMPIQVAGDSSGPARAAAREPVDREPTPEEAALLVETLHATFRGLDERERKIIELGLLGDTDREISTEVGRTQYTVRQVRKRYAGMLADQCEQDPETGPPEP
jgi:RNA polymerase sigma factor (sigma-70 family)